MPPQPKPKSNLLAFLKRFRKPQTQLEKDIMNNLPAFAIHYKALLGKLAEVTAADIAKAAKIKELEGKIADGEAMLAELMALGEGALDSGGSTGGVVG